MRVRFAPSPTGTLHIGSARTALYNFLLARHHGGSFVVRSEDTDVARSEKRFEHAILEDLAWLGLAWDEGPDVGGPYGPYRQSERLDRYREAAAGLLESGAAYRCFCSEARLEELRAAALAAGRTPRYDRSCLALDPAEAAARVVAGEPAAVRLRVPDGEIAFTDLIRGPMSFSSDVIGDFILLRSDGVAAYNFAAAVDDRDMAITHVVRGDDHLSNTARQLLVLAALGAEPPRYAHHSLILGGDGGKLSKRHGATAIGEYRELGYLPRAVTNYLALLSWSHGEDELLELDRLIAGFELERLSASPAIFDRDKLDWLDHQWIMRLPDAEHERLVGERLPAGTPVPAVEALAAAFKPSLERYGEVPALAAPVLERPALDAAARAVAGPAAARLALFRELRAASAADYVAPDAARELLAEYRRVGKQAGHSARELLMPLRVALTGREHGPELHYVLAALDRAETVTRIDAAVAGPVLDSPPSKENP